MELKPPQKIKTIPREQQIQIQERFLKYESLFLKPYATFSQNATRYISEPSDYRHPFTRDADRIIHSLSYARFFDKTQVFFWLKSDMHQHRLLHVQLVSKLAREIGQVLGLNQELIEAIALGHDIGHVPFGHDGEALLSEICVKNGIGQYKHNYGSVWFLQQIEMQNLSLPVVDGILCHNGETHKSKIYPDNTTLTWTDLHETLHSLPFENLDPIPKTMEGALVRVVDTISYISRDVMDAENMKLLEFNQIPESVKNILGTSNREIINSLVSDLIENSLDQPYITYSEEVFQSLQELYKFNLEHIYLHPDKKPPLKIMREAMKAIWDYYLTDLKAEKHDSRIYQDHLLLNLKTIRRRYPNIHNLAEYSYSKQPIEIIIRDFIAGMTDRYFWHIAQELDPTYFYIPNQIIL